MFATGLLSGTCVADAAFLPVTRKPLTISDSDAVMEHVWGSDRVVGERSIDNLMSRLRKKIEDDPDRPQFLQTVWGAGYRFADPRA